MTCFHWKIDTKSKIRKPKKLIIFPNSLFDTREIDSALENFVLEEKQRMSDEHLSPSEKSIKRAPDQKCINHMPPIKRGQKHNSYFRTAGDILPTNLC